MDKFPNQLAGILSCFVEFPLENKAKTFSNFCFTLEVSSISLSWQQKVKSFHACLLVVLMLFCSLTMWLPPKLSFSMSYSSKELKCDLFYHMWSKLFRQKTYIHISSSSPLPAQWPGESVCVAYIFDNCFNNHAVAKVDWFICSIFKASFGCWLWGKTITIA